MQLSNVVEGLQEDLGALAGLGGDAVGEAASLISSAMGGSVTMRLLELLGQAAVELSGQLAGGAVELRISGREAELVYVEDAGAPPGGDLGEDQSARISLRLPEQLKARVEEAAAQEGVSTNAWIVRVLARGAWTGKTAPSRKRLTGYGWA